MPDPAAETAPRHPPLSPAERVAVAILAAGIVAFGIFGYATHAKSTTGYVASVAIVGILVFRVRRRPLPGPLVIALAVDAAAHLAGGLVSVGDDVLYNASVGPWIASLHTHLLQYDHFVHAFGAFLATLTLWALLAPATSSDVDRRHLMVLCMIAGLGIGAINEVIEFLATTTHRAAHIGGYNNTGWDLVSNMIGAVAALPVHAPRRARCRRLDPVSYGRRIGQTERRPTTLLPKDPAWNRLPSATSSTRSTPRGVRTTSTPRSR